MTGIGFHRTFVIKFSKKSTFRVKRSSQMFFLNSGRPIFLNFSLTAVGQFLAQGDAAALRAAGLFEAYKYSFRIKNNNLMPLKNKMSYNLLMVNTYNLNPCK